MILEELKARLRITEDEEDLDLLRPILKKGIAKINNIVGADINYEEDEEAREILLEYGRYSYNNAGEYFEENFSSDLIRLQIKYLRLQNNMIHLLLDAPAGKRLAETTPVGHPLLAVVSGKLINVKPPLPQMPKLKTIT